VFPENMNSVNEDVSKRHFEGIQKELIEKPKKSFFRYLTSTLIAGIALAFVFLLFLWLMNGIRY
jgi:hypothetical protein